MPIFGLVPRPWTRTTIAVRKTTSSRNTYASRRPSNNDTLPSRLLVRLLLALLVIFSVVWFELRLLAVARLTSVVGPHTNNNNERPVPVDITTTTATAQRKNGQIKHISRQQLSSDTRLDDPLVDDQSIPKPIPKETSVNIKKPPPPKYTQADFANCTLLSPADRIYQYGPWDQSPIVISSHKLIFFTIPKVGCTVYKQLFRRMEGYADWSRDEHPLPHAPKRNGLTYLYDYSPNQADELMTDPSWTRAIVVRDPKERLLSAYLDKGTQNPYMQFHCCPKKQTDTLLYQTLQCDNPVSHLGPTASQELRSTTPLLTFEDFLTKVYPSCADPHWDPQSNRIDDKYWPYINFIGHMESIEADTKRLLQRIGAWEEYGASGWPHGSVFAGAASSTVRHATDSKQQLKSYYTQQVERIVDTILERDYEVRQMNFTKRTVAVDA